MKWRTVKYIQFKAQRMAEYQVFCQNVCCRCHEQLDLKNENRHISNYKVARSKTWDENKPSATFELENNQLENVSRPGNMTTLWRLPSMKKNRITLSRSICQKKNEERNGLETESFNAVKILLTNILEFKCFLDASQRVESREAEVIGQTTISWK